MRKETDLRAVKEIAKALLYIDLGEPQLGFLVVHPFFSTTQTFLKSENRFVDLYNEEELELARQEIIRLIDKQKDAISVYEILRKSYKLTFFKFINTYLSLNDFSVLLADAWVMSENPNQDANVSTYQASRFFKKADKKILMSAEEYKVYEELPEEFEVYRGVAVGRNPKGMSWTRDFETAAWFANRFNNAEETGYIQKGVARKENVLAYFGRENEVVIYPKDLDGITVVR